MTVKIYSRKVMEALLSKEKTEEELQDIGRLDMTASCKIFNFVLNHGSFDTECG